MSVNSLVQSAKTSVKNFSQDETGATAIEYGLIAGLIAVAIVAVLGTVGTNLTTIFTTIGSKLKTVSS